MFDNRRNRRKNKKKALEQIKDKTKDRDCGSCQVCCVLLKIPALFKRAGDECKHLRPAKAPTACARYDTRPKVCSEFWCLWRLGLAPGFSRPDESGIVFTAGMEGKFVWIEGHAQDLETFKRHQAELDALAARSRLAIVLRTPKSAQVHCIGSLDDITQIQAIFAARVALKRRLPVV